MDRLESGCLDQIDEVYSVAKANLKLHDGTTVKIDGTAEEVATLLTRFTGGAQGDVPAHRRKASQNKATKKRAGRSSTRSKRKGPRDLIRELTDEGYFNSKRTLQDVQKRLEEKGHIYAQTSLSNPLLALTKARTLRRLKDKKRWVYVS